jgi:uncharacterized glyoxalase superfamily protein PhnB
MKPLAERHQIHGVQPVLPVADVVAAANWFCRTLGFAVDFFHGEPAFYARVKLGDQRRWGDAVYIHLQQSARPIHPCGETRLHVGHDIDGLHAHVLACGATVLSPPANEPWGLREMTLQTPDGHRLVLGAEVGAEVGADMGAEMGAEMAPTVSAQSPP